MQREEALSPFQIMAMRARTGTVRAYVLALAFIIAFLEVFYVLNFQGTLEQFFTRIGLEEVARALGSLVMTTELVEAVILAGIMSVGFMIFPAKELDFRWGREELERYMEKYVVRVPWYDVALSLVSLAVFLYIASIMRVLIAYEGSLPREVWPVAIPMGIVALVLLMELARRSVGLWLVAIDLAFLLYYLYYIRFDLRYWVENMVYWKTGLFNIPFFVMVVYVFAFLFFGSFLEKIGIGEYAINLLLSLFGRRPGGPAKVSVVGSGIMGMLSGSSVANTFTVGVFTIPLMKRIGFPGEVAGGIEASAGTGGQIMPPIMGAAAFIMAAYLGRPYGEIVIAAFLPALIYYAALYVYVDTEAKSRRLGGLPESEIPGLRPLLKRIYLLLPIPLLAALLVMGLAPAHAVVASLGAALLAGAWASSAPLTSKTSYTIAFLLVLGAALLAGMPLVSGVYFAGISFIIISIALLAGKSLKSLAQATISAIEDSVRDGVPIFVAAALAGILQGAFTGTGLSGYLGQWLVSIAAGNLYLLLIITAFIDILVGTGVPTTANYVITALLTASAVATAAQQSVGVDEATALLAAHMFVFYYGIVADVTPPIALAAFAAATIAKSDFWKTSMYATRMAFTKYVLPFVFVVQPGLLVLPILEGRVGVESLIWGLVSIGAVLVNVNAAFAGYHGGHIKSKTLRVALALIGIAAVTTNPYMVILGYAAAIATYILVRAGKA